MSLTRLSFALALCALVLTSSAGRAQAQALAINDSVDFAALKAGAKTVPLCPCFCTYEGFAATLTAPEDMTINYIYILYGALGFTETIVDFHLYEGDEPGAHFMSGSENDVPAIGVFMPININSSQILEIPVSASGVAPPQVAEGEQFTIGFHYNYDPDFGPTDLIIPDGPHAPTYDTDGEATPGTNWVLSWDRDPLEEAECGEIGSPYSWKTLASTGADWDWVIRASEQPIDWTVNSGDDDDATASDDDDAGTDDDDAGTDDDDGGDMIVLAITPTFMVEGESIDIAITGQGFDDTAQVFIGGLAASGVTFVGEQRLDAESPVALPASDTPYDVLISLADGSDSELPRAFEVRVAGGGCGCSSSVAAAGSGGALLALLLLFPLALRRRR